MSIEYFVNIPVPVPPLPEQRAIAAFLARKTAEIDALIAGYDTRAGAKQPGILVRMGELLREYRQTLISAAVTGKFAVPQEGAP